VVSYINSQGGIRSGSLCALVRDILIWAQTNLSSLRAAHIPGIKNLGADKLSWGNTPLDQAVSRSDEELSLDPMTMQC